jgi:hypothetical protein
MRYRVLESSGRVPRMTELSQTHIISALNVDTAVITPRP